MAPIMGAIELGSAGISRSTAGIARLIHAPAAAADCPGWAARGQRGQHAIGTVDERLTAGGSGR
jgi:hypothetical protein